MSSNPQNNLLHNSVRSIFADLIEPQLKNLLMIVTNISNTVERNEMRLDNLEKRLDSLTDIIDTTRNTSDGKIELAVSLESVRAQFFKVEYLLDKAQQYQQLNQMIVKIRFKLI
jgi:hypothetical protein